MNDCQVEFNNELALEETQMDLIIKLDSAFKWTAKDEELAREKKATRRQASVISKAKNIVNKAASNLKSRK